VSGGPTFWNELKRLERPKSEPGLGGDTWMPAWVDALEDDNRDCLHPVIPVDFDNLRHISVPLISLTIRQN